MIRAWFIGMYTQLDGASPAEVIRDGRLKEALAAATYKVHAESGGMFRTLESYLQQFRVALDTTIAAGDLLPIDRDELLTSQRRRPAWHSNQGPTDGYGAAYEYDGREPRTE